MSVSDHSKISAVHLNRAAVVYIRQSTATQVEHNRESTARQYALAERAVDLGWTRHQVSVIDQDLGHSGASAAQRSGSTSHSVTSGLFWGSKSRASRAIMPTGTAYSICAG